MRTFAMPWKWSTSRVTAATILVAVMLAGAFTALDVVPAASQDSSLRAWATEESDALLDPWSGTWGSVKPAVVTLSAQNATKPLGGGEVATIKTRALQDGRRLYVLLEWKDGTKDTLVNGHTVFADSAAIEMPTTAAVAIPSFCMGDATGTVNVWHWKAVWQEDIDTGYTTAANRYPDGFADGYPFDTDPAYQTARAAGNPLSQLNRTSPVENLSAAGFGTLTTADLQDVNGRGEWKDGRWRVVFSRPLKTGDGYPSLTSGDMTNIAFAVWDGSKGNRDGIKSVSQFMNLLVTTAPLPEDGGGFPWWGWVLAGGVIAAFALSAAWGYWISHPQVTGTK